MKEPSKKVHCSHYQWNANICSAKFTPFHRLIALGFSNKGSLNKHLRNKACYPDLLESQRKYWPEYVDGLLSFVVKDKKGRMVGVCINDRLNFDPSEVCGGAHSVTAAASALTHFLKKQIM